MTYSMNFVLIYHILKVQRSFFTIYLSRTGIFYYMLFFTNKSIGFSYDWLNQQKVIDAKAKGRVFGSQSIRSNFKLASNLGFLPNPNLKLVQSI